MCPTTEENAKYVARQRSAFLEGTPAPDFPGGVGESQHDGRPTAEYLKSVSTPTGLQACGLSKLASIEGETPGGLEAVRQANAVLGFE